MYWEKNFWDCIKKFELTEYKFVAIDELTTENLTGILVKYRKMHLR